MNRSRSERFDSLVLDAVERLEPRWGKHLRDVEFAVEDVPPPAVPQSFDDGGIALGRLLPRRGTLPARIIVYRWPLELRSGGDPRELAELVHGVVVTYVADMLNVTPETLDPRLGDLGED